MPGPTEAQTRKELIDRALLRAQQHEALRQVEQLFDALLDRAFRGAV